VEGWQEGDRVVSETAAIISPNNPMTRRGLYNLDPTRKGFGYGVNGAMTQYVRVPSRILHHLPDQLPFEQACLTEPCCVAYNAVVKNARIEPGDRVIVLGPGTIGILCAAMARLCGAEVAIVGLPQDAHRLEIAKQYGCEVIIGDAKPWAQQRDGLGCDGVIDAAGASITLKIALDIVRPAGWISKVGWGPQPLGFNIDPLVQKTSPCKAASVTTGPSGSVSSLYSAAGNSMSNPSSAASGPSPNGTMPSKKCTVAKW
jgi:L-iditol 2-dehydrogenase